LRREAATAGAENAKNDLNPALIRLFRQDSDILHLFDGTFQMLAHWHSYDTVL